jgi:hypothetical protein
MNQLDVTPAAPRDAFDLQPPLAPPATAQVQPTTTDDGRGMLAVLSQRTVKHLEQQLRPGERVVAVIKGAAKQAIVALDTRLFIVKPGLMAGSTFGARVTSFDYRQITAIELNKKLTTAVIEVIAAGYQGTQATSYWSQKEGKDPFKISNCLPLPRSDATKAEPVLALIRERIERAHAPAPAPAAMVGGVAEQLEKLAQLRAQGVLSEDEFAAAKARVLDNG